MVDGDAIVSGEKLLATTLNQIFPVHIAKSPVSLVLKAMYETVAVFHAERACTLKKATLLYTEATSSDTGVTLEVGKETDRDYYYTGTSEVSKDQWYSKDVTLLQTDVDAGDTVTFYCAGSKSGNGKVALILEYYYTT